MLRICRSFVGAFVHLDSCKQDNSVPKYLCVGKAPFLSLCNHPATVEDENRQKKSCVITVFSTILKDGVLLLWFLSAEHF